MNPVEIKILVVDDDPDVLEGTVRLLEKAGYAVKRASTGGETLQIIQEYPADLLLLDRDLPDINGIEVCRRIKQNPALKDTLVVFVSSLFTESNEQSEGLESGADGYITRPIANRELLARVESYVRIHFLTSSMRLLSEQLRKSQKLLNETERVAKVGGWELDLENKKLLWTEEVYRLHEVDSDFVPTLEKSIDFHINSSKPIIERVVQLAIENGEPFDVELEIISAKGNPRSVHAIGKTDLEHGKIFCTVQDITERKRLEAEKAILEEQNRQLQKAESLGLMSGSIAHHFNNQLQIVMGYLGMVIGELPPRDPRAVKLATAMQATMKAAEVSTSLLAYLGKKQVKPESLDLAELCRMSLNLIQAEKPENVLLESDLPSPGPCISADAKQIQRILTNLAINARESIGEGAGTIHIGVRTVFQADIPSSHRFPVDWRPSEQNYACLEVKDSGCGIKEEDIEKLFDPFFSTKFTGRGLGLSIVLGIAKAHAAVVTVENRINGGSVFRVFFPLSAQKAPPLDKQIAKAPEIAAGGTVLLVEDEAALREMTRLALVHFGFTVLQAKDGIEAVEIFKKHKDEISCVLTSLTMTRMGGWETIAALRAIRHDLPVVLASAYDEARAMAGRHTEMPDFFLNKPYDIDKLGDTIGKAIGRKF
jgi:DNA-binding response OmpR family regulator/nitrogen-specific signal transduction histidine kinase